MKKLDGIKKSIASLENKKLKDLQSIQGGIYLIRSNIPTQAGSAEYDTYESNGGAYTGRFVAQLPQGPAPDLGNWNGCN